jgi:hypothetical protein
MRAFRSFVNFPGGLCTPYTKRLKKPILYVNCNWQDFLVVVSRKAILSLLISVVLFAGFTVLAYTDLFDLVETRFYNPSVVKAINRKLTGETQTIEQFLTELQTRFAATLEEEAVRRSFAANQSSDDIGRRADLYGNLMESLTGLQSVRFVDAQGIRIHYSTWQPDILRQDRDSIRYQNYTESPGYIPYWQVETPDRGTPHLVIDDIGERIIFSYPFYDSYAIYRGTALFSLSARALMDRMAAEGQIKVGEDVSVISEPAGIVTGLPHAGKSALLPLISQIWRDNILSLSRLHSGLTGSGLALMSMKTTQGIYIGRLVNESVMGFPRTMRIILLVSFLLTIYLILFLLLNIRQDTMTVIQNRIKELQINLIKEYYAAKGDLDWNHWRKELQQRKKELRAEIKRGLETKGKGKHRAGEDAEIDALMNKSWNELLSSIGGAEPRAGIDEEKLKALVEQYLLRAPGQTQPPKEPMNESPEIPVPEDREKIDEPEELEELEELIEELDEPEELEELEELEPMEGTTKTRELDPSELVESEGDPGKVNPASKVEFSPLPEEIEKQKDAAAKSMAEKVKIQSPFPVIFSGLSENEEPAELLSLEEEALEPAELLPLEEEAPEPAELLPLEEEAPESEGPMTTEVKPLNIYFVKPLLSVPFSTALNTEIEVLDVQDMDDDAIREENTVIAKRNGVPHINERILSPDKKTIKSLNPNFKRLVKSVLSND